MRAVIVTEEDGKLTRSVQVQCKNCRSWSSMLEKCFKDPFNPHYKKPSGYCDEAVTK